VVERGNPQDFHFPARAIRTGGSDFRR
jgi:hypothetical protein